MSFGLYILGVVLLIGGVAWGLDAIGVPTQYIAIAAIIIAGLGIMTGVSRTRTKDVSGS